MTIQRLPIGGWNLFARVLQEILSVRGYGLGYIDDRTSVHPEKVRRLQRSLKVPKSFPVLNIDEMQQVITAFNLKAHERIQLRAALLATAIEEMLMDRINQDDALKAAEQLFVLIEQALYDHADETTGIGVTKSEVTNTTEDMEIDLKMGNALASIDYATRLLHLSDTSNSHLEGNEYAQQALTRFEIALSQLSKAPLTLKETDAWQIWHEEAQNGLAIAHKRRASFSQ